MITSHPGNTVILPILFIKTFI